MSLVDDALVREGLKGLLEDRLADRSHPTRGSSARVEIARRGAAIDPILLGAMADRVRAAERGDLVRIFIDRPPVSEVPHVRHFGPGFDPSRGGLAFVREIALARLVGASDLAIRVDVEAVGLQIAQVALPFGADELVAPLRTLRLAVMEEDEVGTDSLLRPLGKAKGSDSARAILRERELAVLVRAARRRPRIVEVVAGVEQEREVDETTLVKRAFRAPGREQGAIGNDAVQAQGES